MGVFFAILGLIAGLVAFVGLLGTFFGGVNDRSGFVATFIVAGFISVLLIGGSAVRTVGSGEVGVVSRFGEVREQVFQEGLHFTNPLNKVTTMSVRTQQFTMSGESAITAKSKDGATLTIEVTVLFRLDPLAASTVFQTLGKGYGNVILVPAARAEIRQAATRMTAIEAFDETKRAEFALDIEAGIRRAIDGRGVFIEQVQVRNIELPTSVNQAISEKLSAEQAAERKDFELAATIKDAEIRREEARGIRDAQEIINETLSDKYLQFEYIQVLRSIANGPNDTFVIMPMDQSLTPMLNLNPSGGSTSVPATAAAAVE